MTVNIELGMFVQVWYIPNRSDGSVSSHTDRTFALLSIVPHARRNEVLTVYSVGAEVASTGQLHS
jgi:hypothetical protein